eukprot:3906012-Pleurochrysis_carterae.AAC.1
MGFRCTRAEYILHPSQSVAMRCTHPSNSPHHKHPGTLSCLSRRQLQQYRPAALREFSAAVADALVEGRALHANDVVVRRLPRHREVRVCAVTIIPEVQGRALVKVPQAYLLAKQRHKQQLRQNDPGSDLVRDARLTPLRPGLGTSSGKCALH